MYLRYFLAQNPGCGSCCEALLQCRRSRCRWPGTCPPEASSCSACAQPCWGGSWMTLTPCSPLIRDDTNVIAFIALYVACQFRILFVFRSLIIAFRFISLARPAPLFIICYPFFSRSNFSISHPVPPHLTWSTGYHDVFFTRKGSYWRHTYFTMISSLSSTLDSSHPLILQWDRERMLNHV